MPANVRHIVGLQRRLAPHNRYVHDLIQQGYIGTLRSVRIHVSMNYFQPLRSVALRWTVPPENFSSVIAIYAGHFLDMLFASTGWPNELSALVVNQFKEVTITETGEKLPTTTPDQMVLTGRLEDDAVLTVHIEGGKRNGSGVQIDITGTEGDLRITKPLCIRRRRDNYEVEGAHGDNLPLQVLPVRMRTTNCRHLTYRLLFWNLPSCMQHMRTTFATGRKRHRIFRTRSECTS